MLDELKIANDFVTRALGLMGKKDLATNQGVYFPRCNWIHTCFMSMSIDVIYLDKAMVVRKIDSSLKPWRVPAPVFSANSVIEVRGGWAKNKIEVGDNLYVGN